MIQNPKENKIPLLFVHIPKTGGGTVKNYFSYTKKNVTGERTGHSKLKEINIKFYADPKSNLYPNNDFYNCIPFDNYFKFVIFRNPWERILSEFNFRTRTHVLNIKNPLNPDLIKYWIEIIKKKYNFKDWVLHLHEEVGIENTIENYIYYNYITLDGKIGVDYIINLHNLNEDFELIKKISNRTECLSIIKKASNGKNIHSKKHEFFKTYYDDKTIELVEKIHAKDIELFNFSFDNYEYADLEKFYNLEKIKNILQEIESIK